MLVQHVEYRESERVGLGRSPLFVGIGKVDSGIVFQSEAVLPVELFAVPH